MAEKTFIYENKKKIHKYVQEMFNTPVTTHKVIMNQFTGEQIALAETKDSGKWFVVYLAGDTASEFGTDEVAARKAFMAWKD